jgi:hypothetical protein
VSQAFLGLVCLTTHARGLSWHLRGRFGGLALRVAVNREQQTDKECGNAWLESHGVLKNGLARSSKYDTCGIGWESGGRVVPQFVNHEGH